MPLALAALTVPLVLVRDSGSLIATVPLVMERFGPMGRWPSPVPRIASGKMCTSSACSLPSGPLSAAEPTKSPGLMSESLAFPFALILTSAGTLTEVVFPSDVRTTRVVPSKDEMTPRKRTGAFCANKEKRAARRLRYQEECCVSLLSPDLLWICWLATRTRINSRDQSSEVCGGFSLQLGISLPGTQMGVMLFQEKAD